MKSLEEMNDFLRLLKLLIPVMLDRFTASQKNAHQEFC